MPGRMAGRTADAGPLTRESRAGWVVVVAVRQFLACAQRTFLPGAVLMPAPNNTGHDRKLVFSQEITEPDYDPNWVRRRQIALPENR